MIEEVRPIEIGTTTENENESENEEEMEEVSSNEEEQSIEDTPLRRSTRTKNLPTRLRDFITYKVQYPIQDFISYGNVSSNHRAFLTSIEKEQ